LSTRAIRTSEVAAGDGATSAPEPRRPAAPLADPPAWLAVLRYLDLGLLAVTLPIFLAAGLPLLGWGAAAGAWLVQRGIRALVERRAAVAEDPRTVVGLTAASMIGRGWLMALTVFGAGMLEREAGLASAVLLLALFTVLLSTEMVLRPFGPARAQAPRGARR